jgi:hypothetical protein
LRAASEGRGTPMCHGRGYGLVLEQRGAPTRYGLPPGDVDQSQSLAHASVVTERPEDTSQGNHDVFRLEEYVTVL